MKNIIPILFITVAMIMDTSCKKSFDSLSTDQNRPTNVPPGLVLNGVLSDIYQGPFNPTQRWSQFYCCNYAYYGDQQYTWTGLSYNAYNTLNNVIKMEEEAAKSIPAPNAYSALGKYLRAILFYNLTMQTGDVPMADALKGLGNLAPAYSTQKDVFKQILTWLEEANTDIGVITAKGNYILTNDFYYNNDLNKWRKAVNSFKLRILIQLSKQEADADLNIKQKFNEVMTNSTRYPIFTDMSDNLQYVFNSQYNKYPTNQDAFGFDAARYNLSLTYLGNLATLQDPRTFYVAEPAAAQVARGIAPSSFDAFKGAGSGEDLATMSVAAGLGEYSFINRKRYYSTYTAENCIQVGYPEMCFNIAEAINRGWTTGNAEDWYMKGIQASIGFYGIITGNNTVNFQKPGGGLNDYNSYTISFNWTTYYNQPSVKYAGNTAAGLNQILLQKYLAFYQNSGWEAYYNWRRTAVPAFHTGPGSGNSQRVALRFQYPVSEKSINLKNVSSAIQSQFGGTDDINAKMWIIK